MSAGAARPERGILPAQLVMAAGEVFAVSREARLVKNQVGNLQVFIGEQYMGYLDLQTGEVEWEEWVQLPWRS